MPFSSRHLTEPLPMLRAILLAVFSLVTFSSAHAENWPQWRGPEGNSVSLEQNLPLFWSETSGVIWKTELPEWGTSTPAIWGDAIFVTSQQEDKLLLQRLDKKTGKILWTQEVGTTETVRQAEKRTVQKFHQLHNNASPSPVTDGELVIVHFGNGDLAAYDFAGKQLWHHNLQKEYGSYSIWWGHANSPVLVGDLVVSVCMQDSLDDVGDKQAPSYLVAHDKRTGVEKWKSMRMTKAKAEECDSYTTPVLYQTPKRLELIVSGADTVDAYDPATGKQLWYLPGLAKGRTITGPVIGNGMVYATRGMRGDLMAVKVGGQGELTSRAVAWKHSESTPDSSSPVLWKHLLFTVADNGVAQCYDAITGHLKWKQRVQGNYKASPLAAEGRIYFLNMKGLCTVVSASDRFDKLAENQIGDPANNPLGCETSASPAVSDGRIYLRTRQALYCIGK
jgi:outer membrane protein assembly factor BamB